MNPPQEAHHDDSGPLPPARGESRRRKSHWASSCLRARLSLVAVFFVLRGLDAYIYFQTPGTDKAAMLGAIGNGVVWTTFLLAAVYIRKSWARYVLAGFLPLNMLAVLFMVPDLMLKMNADSRMATVLGVIAIVDTVVIWHLLFSSDLHRLTGRSRS